MIENNDNSTNEQNIGNPSFIESSKTNENINEEERKEKISFSGEVFESLKELKEKIELIQRSSEILEQQQEESKQQQKRLKQQQEFIKKRAQKNQNKIIETMGVFVALFTFISVSTTILLQFQDVYNALFFMSIFLLALVSFLIVFHIILNKEVYSFFWLLAFMIPLIIAGFTWYQSKDKNKNIIEENVKKVEKQVIEYEQKIKELQEKVRYNEKEIYTLQVRTQEKINTTQQSK